MAKKEAFLQFLKAARSLQDRGLSKEAIVQFAKNEFGELSELFKKQIDSLFKPKKGIENIKIKDPDFDDTVIKLPIDDTGKPFNPRDPLKDYSKELTDSPLDDLKKIVDDFEPIGPPKPKKSRMLDEDEIAELDMDIGGLEYTNDFDGTVESANKLRKEHKQYIADMELEYKKGNLDPEPGSYTPQRKKFLQDRFDEMESSGDNRLMTRDEVEELASFDLQLDMDKAVEKSIKKDAKQKKIIKDFDPGDRDPNAEGGRAGYGLGNLVSRKVSATATPGSAPVSSGSGTGLGGMISNIIRDNPQMFTPVQNYAVSDNSILGPAAKSAASNIMEGQAKNQAALNIFNQSTPKVDARMNLDYDTLISQNEAQRNLQAQQRNPGIVRPTMADVAGPTATQDSNSVPVGTRIISDGRNRYSVRPNGSLSFINTVTPNEKDYINNFNKGPIEGYKFIGNQKYNDPSVGLNLSGDFLEFTGYGDERKGDGNFKYLQDINQTGMPKAITQDDMDTFNFNMSDPMMTGFDYSKENNWSPGQPAPDGYRVAEIMGDKFLERMYPSKQEIAGLPGMIGPMGPMPLGLMMPPSGNYQDNFQDPDAGLSGQEIAEKYGIPYAKGGRAGYYTGGMVDVEPNLSDIGHGSDALMARTRLVSPDGQATTSTGLNYLLAEDNDNIRVPFKEKGKVSLLDLIKVNASGSKSGRQQIQGAPKGITADNETINAIINLDIPINEKINILGSYAYGKGRNKIEDKGQEIFLDEGGYKSRNIGLGFNQDGEGLSGSVIRNLETGDDDVQIKFLKRFAEGGRIGFKSGKLALADAARRKFMKAAGTGAAGLAALKTGLLGFGKEAAPVVEKVAETAVDFTKGVPPYFFRLVEKIKFMGDSTLATKDKANAYKFKDYVMEEDFAGNIEIIKKGEDLGGNKLEDVYMSYKVDDVPVKGKNKSSKVEEYEEYTARPDAEGKMKDIEPGIPDEVVEEAGDIDAMTLKKASGGIARMIGE